MALPLLLLAEDDEDSVFFFERYFKNTCHQWRFAWVNNGLAAAQYIDQIAKPSVLVTDLHMPGADGFDLIKNVRAKRHLANFPIYVYSSTLDPSLRARCLRLGATDCFCKQTSLSELKNMIQLISTLKSESTAVANQEELVR